MIERLFISATAVLLVTIDFVTKETLHTHEWALHERTLTWQCVTAVVLVIPTMFFCYWPMRWTGALLFAGLSGNLFSSIVMDSVANPFVIDNPFINGDQVAFNVADVVLLLGGCTAVFEIPWIAKDLKFRIGHHQSAIADQQKGKNNV